ncbi:MAG: hypothetical protein HY513_03615 [Candidatus Aenigmarchaeota archaeon]|nr:hypothetical protein [Candidatus Aenigmarchaeota archaeon]
MADDDNFIYFLVAGLVVIAILLAAFNLGGYVNTQPAVDRNITFREPIIVKNLSGAVLVGFIEKDAFQSFPFLIDVKNTRDMISKDLGSFRIYNGLLFGEQGAKYRIATKGMDSLSINYEILNTNDYGNIIIKANGVELVNERQTAGTYQIDVPNTILGDSVLVEVMAGSSTWKIWAPTVYDLNMQLEAKGFADTAREFRFILLDDFIELTDAKLNLAFDKAVGGAEIRLNNRLVFNGLLQDTQAIDIDKSFLEIGENVVTFVPWQDSIFEGRASLVAFFKVPQENIMRVPLNFTLSEVEHLPGTITFDIVDIQKPGGFSVKLFKGNEVLFADFATLAEGRYVFELRNAKVGINALTIQAVDGAAFLLKNLDVRI